MRILFVDDDELVLRGMQRVLRSAQPEWEMEFVDSGMAALARLDAAPFDALVSDMRMPGMDGAELLLLAMQRHPRTIRLALSGYADRELIMRCAGAAHQYLAKPCDAATLEGVLTRLARLVRSSKDDRIRQIVANCPALPVVPEVFSRLAEQLNTPDCLLEDIGRIVAEDPGLSTQVLKLVNSAFFGMGRKISHPTEAVQFLGIDTVKSLVLGAHLFKPGEQALPADFSSQRLWAHCLACADAAKSIARDLGAGAQVAGDAYVAGLLHDIGQLLIAANLTAEYEQVVARARREHIPLEQAEQRVLGVDHAEVGGYFIGLFGLPPPVVEAVVFHHQPSAAVDLDSIPLAALHLADVLVGPLSPSVQTVPPSRLDSRFIHSRGLQRIVEAWNRPGHAAPA